ncbi:MAG: VWA domain-containing protein [Bacilli bacterium]|nr:VWA domain-containing protein [Bacilli bacterium]
MEDRIAKRTLNVVLLVDVSTSMRGKRIAEVNAAIEDVRKYLIEFEKENVNVDFMLTVIPFGTTASYLGGKAATPVGQFRFTPLKAGGQTNLECAYHLLREVLTKTSKGGMMPDFGGLAPIILLLTDGHPGSAKYKDELAALQTLPWFRASLRYGVAIELNDKKTIRVLQSFVQGGGEVIQCVNQGLLKRIIQVIILTASKVRSSATEIHYQKHVSVNTIVQQQIAEALDEIGDEEWD